MHELIKYLKSLGFKEFGPSKLAIGRAFVSLVKGEVYFHFGLSEYKKPHTLITPRPKITFHRGKETLCEKYDDSINFVLSNVSPADILDAILNEKTIVVYA